MRFKGRKAKIVSGVLFSSTFFIYSNHDVLALSASTSPTVTPPNTTGTTVTPSSSVPNQATPPLQNTPYTGNSNLDTALNQATSQGISLVETPQTSVASSSQQTNEYQDQTTAITEITNQYIADKTTYTKEEQAYQDYLAKQVQYQKDLASYQDYLKAKASYDQQMKVYNTAKASYDMAYNQALATTNKTGYLPEVLAQNLIFRLEPNATQTITGKLLSDADLTKATKNSMGWIDPGTIIGNPKLATLTTKNKWNSALVSVGDSVVVDYTGLENSSFSGHALTHVRYTYKLISTTHYSGKVVLQAISDPTVTSYTHIYNKDDKTESSFEFELMVQLFDAQGNEMIPSASNYALTSFASLNSRNGNGEYVSNYNGRFIPINGSTISVKNGKAVNFSSTDQSTLISGWDNTNSPDAYIGAIVGQSTDRIIFHFGNNKGFADWFAFNSDVKANGLIQAPPIMPIAPKVVIKPIQPTAVAKPSSIPTPIIFYHKVLVVTPPTNTTRPAVKPTYDSSPKTYQYYPSVIYRYATPVKNYGKIYHIPLVTTANTSNNLPDLWTSFIRKAGSIVRNSNPQKGTNSKTPEEWFNYNTGVNDFKSGNKDVIEYIKSLGKEARRRYHSKSIKDREIAQAIADKSYHNDGLQTKFNYFGKPLKGSKNNTSRKKIDIAHDYNTGQIDLAHLATTLASLESQGKHGVLQELLKLLASTRGIIKIGNSFIPIFASNQKSTIRQLNSFIGDIFTDMPKSDVYTDMDIMILSKHSKYKDMPMDQRIIAYYSQDLSKNRKKLFEEVYGKSKNESENNFIKELVGSGAVLSILALLAYSAKNKKLKNIPTNIHLIDTMLLSGKIDRFKKHPIKTTLTATKKAFRDHLVKPMTKFVKNHITKPIKKFIVKPIVSVYHKTTGKINKVKNSIHRFLTRPKPSPRKIIRRVLPPVRRVVKKVYHRIVPKPVRRVVHHVRTVYRKYVRPVFRNIVRSKARHHRRRKS